MVVFTESVWLDVAQTGRALMFDLQTKMMRPWVETARSAAGTGTDQSEGDRSCSLMSVSAGGHLERYSVIQ